MQGDTQAPYLFVSVIDYIIRVALEGKDFRWARNLQPAQLAFIWTKGKGVKETKIFILSIWLSKHMPY
jgi:hypothetical protein